MSTKAKATLDTLKKLGSARHRTESFVEAPNDNIDRSALGHFLHNTVVEPGTRAPLGLDPTDEKQLTQGTVFDALDSIEDSSTKAQGYNALAYRGGFAAIMSAHSLLKKADFDLKRVDLDDDADGAVQSLLRNAALYNFAFTEGFTYATNAFERPQDLDAIYTTALKQNARKSKELKDDEREALGLSAAEAEAMYRRVVQRAEHNAKAAGESLEAHKHEVIALVRNVLDNVGDTDPSHRFSPDQHDALYECVAKALERNRLRAIEQSMEFDGDLANQRRADAMELNLGRKLVEKHRASFRRANMNELRYAA